MALDRFHSTTITSGDPFYKLRLSSFLTHGGVTPSIAANTSGVRGNARPHGDLYSIGADELYKEQNVVVVCCG